MTVSSFIGVLGTLGLVLGLLLVTLRLLKRLSVTTATGLAPLPLRVEQRLAVGPRQGIAIVRIGTRVVAVSTGEGGVRRIADVTDDAEALNPTTETDGSEPINTMGAGDPTAPTGFGNILRTAIKRSLPLVFALACALPSMGAQATKAPATAPATAPAKAAAKAATKTAIKAPAGKGTAKPATPVAQTPVQPTAGRADTMIVTADELIVQVWSGEGADADADGDTLTRRRNHVSYLLEAARLAVRAAMRAGDEIDLHQGDV